MLKIQRLHNRKKFNFNEPRFLPGNKKFFLFLGFLCLVLLFVFFLSRLFLIKKITFHLNNLYCVDQATLEKNLNLVSKNILFLNQVKISQELFKKYPCIGKVDIINKYPQLVEVNIDSRKPALILNVLKLASDSGSLTASEVQIASGSSFLNIEDDKFSLKEKLVVDDTGVVFSNDFSKYQLPQTEYIGELLQIGGSGNESLAAAIYIIKKLPQMSVDITRSLILGGRAVIVLSSQKIIFSLEKDKDIQLASLQLILQKAKMSTSGLSSTKMGSKVINTIDLRFDKPIVIYTPKKN